MNNQLDSHVNCNKNCFMFLSLLEGQMMPKEFPENENVVVKTAFFVNSYCFYGL